MLRKHWTLQSIAALKGHARTYMGSMHAIVFPQSCMMSATI